MNDTADTTQIPASNTNAETESRSNDVLWSASPGQVIHLPLYSVLIVLGAMPAIYAPGVWALSAVVPLLVGAWYAAKTYCTRYELREQVLRKTWGVFNDYGPEEIELYRVNDSFPKAPFLYRLYGRGNVTVYSTDTTASELTLSAIKNHKAVREQIRERTEAMREGKGSRLVE